MQNVLLKKSFTPLLSMPYFWMRFITFSVILACNCFVRIFFHVGPAGPQFSLGIVIPTLVILLLCIILFFTFEIKVLIKLKPSFRFVKQPLFIIWLVFSSICLISGIINLAPLYSSIIFIFMPLFVLMMQEEHFDTFLLWSCALSFVVDVIAGIIWHPLFSNSFALALAALAPCVLCIMSYSLLHNTKSDLFNLILAFVALLTIMYFTFISGGRSGLLSIIATIFAFICAKLIKPFVLKRNIKIKYTPIAIITTIVLIVLFIAIIGGILFFEYYFEPVQEYESIEGLNVKEKLIVSIKNGNPFSSRSTIWKYTLKNANLIGHSPDFYLNTDGILAEHQNQAHNVLAAVLGHYGIFAFVAFLVFCFAVIIRAIHYALAHKHLYLFPILTLIGFLAAGICEDILIMWSPHLFTVLFYGACAYLIVRKEKDLKKENLNLKQPKEQQL